MLTAPAEVAVAALLVDEAVFEAEAVEAAIVAAALVVELLELVEPKQNPKKHQARR